MLLSFSEGINVWWHDGMMVRRQGSARGSIKLKQRNILVIPVEAFLKDPGEFL